MENFPSINNVMLNSKNGGYILDELEIWENESELTLTSGHGVGSMVQKTHRVSHLRREREKAIGSE